MIVNSQFDEKINKLINDNKDKFEQTLISVIVPCYNEEKTIASVLNTIPALPKLEIIVVDDGSTDRSKEIIKQFENVKLIVHEKNKGYGKTLLDGILAANGDYLVTMDADGQHEPRDIVTLILSAIENDADVVVGSRYKGIYYYSLPWTTRIGEAFVEIVLALLFQAKVKNNQGGFRAFRKKTAKNIFSGIEFLGFEFATETLIRAKIFNYTITESPIHLYNREHGKSRINLPKLLISLIHCFAHYAVKKYLGEQVLKQFSYIVHKLKLSKLYQN